MDPGALLALLFVFGIVAATFGLLFYSKRNEPAATVPQSVSNPAPAAAPPIYYPAQGLPIIVQQKSSALGVGMLGFVIGIAAGIGLMIGYFYMNATFIPFLHLNCFCR